MLNDMAWRKIPRDLMTNPRIRSIAMRIDPRLRQAVFAFYPACLMQATDDGILDISDTEVFADLLLLENEMDIVELRDLFIKRGFFEPINEEKSLLYILDWDNPNTAHVYNNKRVPETAEERRARVLDAINKKPKKGRKSAAPEAKPQDPLFFDDLRDKNAKSVATNREIREEIRDIETVETEEIEAEREIEHTHTESTVSTVYSMAGEALGEEETEGQIEPEVGQEEVQEGQSEEKAGQNDRNPGHTVQEESAEIKAQSKKESLTLPPAQWTAQDTVKYSQEMNIPAKAAGYMTALKSYEAWRTCGVFWAFFTKNNAVGLQTERQLDFLEQLTFTCEQIKELKNPGYVIAGALCTAFQDLINASGTFKGLEYFRGMLPTPENFLKPSVYPRIYNEAKRKLSPGKTAGEKWTEVMDRYAREAEKDAESYNRAAAFTSECKAWGIDPSSPGAYSQYCAKLAQMIRGSSG